MLLDEEDEADAELGDLWEENRGGAEVHGSIAGAGEADQQDVASCIHSQHQQDVNLEPYTDSFCGWKKEGKVFDEKLWHQLLKKFIPVMT